MHGFLSAAQNAILRTEQVGNLFYTTTSGWTSSNKNVSEQFVHCASRLLAMTSNP